MRARLPHDEGRAERDGVKHEGLGYRPDETICVVTVGGSAVGLPLLRTIARGAAGVAARLAGLI